MLLAETLNHEYPFLTHSTVLVMVVVLDGCPRCQDLLLRSPGDRSVPYVVLLLIGAQFCPFASAGAPSLFGAFEMLRGNYSPSVTSVTLRLSRVWAILFL